jgi:hypothetical protein
MVDVPAIKVSDVGHPQVADVSRPPTGLTPVRRPPDADHWSDLAAQLGELRDLLPLLGSESTRSGLMPSIRRLRATLAQIDLADQRHWRGVARQITADVKGALQVKKDA